MVRNQDARPEAYREMETAYRPSHADFTYQAKFGIRNWQGGGRASARETIGRVAAAAIAKKVLAKFVPKMEVVSFVQQIHTVKSNVDPNKVKFSEVEGNIVRWPVSKEAPKLIRLIEKM